MKKFSPTFIHTVKWELIQLVFILIFLCVSYFQEFTILKVFSRVGIFQREAIQGYLNSLQFFLFPDFFYILFPQVMVVSIGLLLFKKWRWYFYAVVGIFISLLHISDRIYAKFFASVISISSISIEYLKHAWAVKSSLPSGIYLLDVINVATFLIFVIFGFIYNRHAKMGIDDNPKGFVIDKMTGILFFLLAIYLYNIAFFLPKRYVILDDQNKLQISTKPFKNAGDDLLPNYKISSRYFAATFGLMNYHVQDVINFLKADPETDRLSKSNIVELLGVLENKKRLNDIKSPFFGAARGRNVFLIHFESLNPLVIDLKIDGVQVAPTLNKLTHDYMYWHNILDQVRMAGSSDAEFMALTGMLPDTGRLVAFNSEIKDKLNSLPRSLKQIGYETIALHGFDASFWMRNINLPLLGIDTMYFKNEFTYEDTDILGMGLSDKQFFLQAVDKLANHASPFFAYLITLSTHHPYDDIPKDYENLFNLKNYEGSLVIKYLRLIRYSDDALGAFFTKIKKAGLWDKSIFVIYGDHIPVLGHNGEKYLMQIAGKSIALQKYERVPIIIVIPGKEGLIQKYKKDYNDIVGGQHDIFPTIMHILGQDIPLGIFGTHLFVPNAKRGIIPSLKNLDNFVYNGVLYLENGSMPCKDSDGIVFTDNSDALIKKKKDQIRAYKKAFRAVQLNNMIIHHNINVRSLGSMIKNKVMDGRD